MPRMLVLACVYHNIYQCENLILLVNVGRHVHQYICIYTHIYNILTRAGLFGITGIREHTIK